MFMQLEGLVVDKGISLSHLLATMKTFLQTLFEQERSRHSRCGPATFPLPNRGLNLICPAHFVRKAAQPAKEHDGLRSAAAGLTHPNVLRACNIDPDVYSGFAFGMGLTRFVMLKYGISDIRLLHGNKLEFLQQF